MLASATTIIAKVSAAAIPASTLHHNAANASRTKRARVEFIRVPS
jgi:hypothetical protein